MNTTENNKLIAEFMGVDEVDIDTWLETNSNLHYHTSWDWLMPVLIECFKQFGDTNTINYMSLNDALLTCNIDEVYKVVVEFIKEQTKTQDNDNK